MNDWTVGSEKSEAGNLGYKLNSLLCYVSVDSAIARANFGRSLFTAGLGDHEPSGLCRARVSEDERVGGSMGECHLPRLQLFPKVRSTFLHVSLSMHTSAVLTLVHILPPYDADKRYTVCSTVADSCPRRLTCVWHIGAIKIPPEVRKEKS